MSDILLAQAALGRDAEEFLESDIGRYLLGRAEQDEQEAKDALAEVAWWRRRRIQDLQNKVWRARSVRAWLAELVIEGRQAEELLEQQ